MKSYTDLEQSKKLAEILPIESADMSYHYFEPDLLPEGYCVSFDKVEDKTDIPCWSLAALLEILDPIAVAEKIAYQIINENDVWYYHVVKYFHTSHGPVKVTSGKSRVDAVFEMIVYLKENKLI